MKALVTATVIVALALAALLGGVARESRSATPAAPAPVEAEALRSGFAPGDTQALLLRLQADVAARPDDAHPLALLGLAYAQRARETGDAAYVSRADRALRRAVKLEPEDFEALTGLGGVALTRHRFRDALALGRRALAAAPGTAAPYGVLGDALLELGRYDAAFAAFDRMAALKPNTSSYARVSYARELRGDVAGSDRRDGARAGRRGRPSRGLRLDCRRARQAALVGRPRGACRLASTGSRSQLVPATHLRSTRWRDSRRRGAARPRGRAPAARGRGGSAPQLRRAARRPARARPAGRGEAREQYALVGAIERLQAANGVEDRPRDRALPHRPRHPPRARRSRSPAWPTSAGPRSPATTCSPGRSPATAAAARRAAGRSARSGSARATPRSSSTAG